MYIYPYDFNNRNEEKQCKKDTMIFQGKGTIKVQPDIAVINIGVVTENMELAAAQQENAQKANEIINTLKSMGIEEKDIKTQNYSIDPIYDYVEGRQVFKGYRVINNLTVTIRDINEAGRIIDAVVRKGANTVSNISFTSSDIRKYYNRALIIAVRDAIEKAKVVGDYLRVDVSTVPYSIIEQGYDYAPVVEATQYKLASADTPIMKGQIEVTASIRAEFYF